MMTRALVVAALILAGLLCSIDIAGAQYTLGGMNLEGEVETGARFFLQEPSKKRAAPRTT